MVRVSSLLAELSKMKEKYTGVVVMPQENRMIALSASSSDSGLGKHLNKMHTTISFFLLISVRYHFSDPTLKLIFHVAYTY